MGWFASLSFTSVMLGLLALAGCSEILCSLEMGPGVSTDAGALDEIDAGP